MAFKLSIIIPVYNQEKLIVRALDSIPKRDDIEIVIVDDCSTDNTGDVINNYGRLDNLKLFRNSSNLGVGLSMRKAFENISGKGEYTIDSDDYLITDKFLEIYNRLDTDLEKYDIIRIDNELNDGSIEHDKHTAGGSYFLKNRFDIQYPDIRKAGDWLFGVELNKVTKNIISSGVCCYHYNDQREGSIVGNYNHNITDGKGDPIE